MSRPTNYDEFVSGKLAHAPPCGLASPPAPPPWLFPFQADLVTWALKRGRAAIFAGTGLGKTRMQLAWASAVATATGRRVLVLAPLAVARQTVAEGAAVGVGVTLCREAEDVRDGINVTNYDRLHRFDASAFGAVVLDESSCIKHHDTATLRLLLDAFASTPYRLACTATPAPNDWTELGTHAEFLGVRSRAEMLAEFFTHDGGDTSEWRLKGHARRAFWAWVASWGALVSHPRDLGYEAAGYDLPPLRLLEHMLPSDHAESQRAGYLFAREASTLSERRTARKVSIERRVEACASLVAAEPRETWIVWCDLNAESTALVEAIPGAVEVTGSMDADEKECRLVAFGEGRSRVLVTKPSICGFGLNWQHCARVAFVGVTDSWEAYYQAVRRCWRFGQDRAVDVHVFASESEGSVVANLKRKDRDATELAAALASETGAAVRAEVRGVSRESNDYRPTETIRVPSWLRSEEVTT